MSVKSKCKFTFNGTFSRCCTKIGQSKIKIFVAFDFSIFRQIRLCLNTKLNNQYNMIRAIIFWRAEKTGLNEKSFFYKLAETKWKKSIFVNKIVRHGLKQLKSFGISTELYEGFMKFFLKWVPVCCVANFPCLSLANASVCSQWLYNYHLLLSFNVIRTNSPFWFHLT